MNEYPGNEIRSFHVPGRTSFWLHTNLRWLQTVPNTFQRKDDHILGKINVNRESHSTFSESFFLETRLYFPIACSCSVCSQKITKYIVITVRSVNITDHESWLPGPGCRHKRVTNFQRSMIWGVARVWRAYCRHIASPLADNNQRVTLHLVHSPKHKSYTLSRFWQSYNKDAHFNEYNLFTKKQNLLEHLQCVLQAVPSVLYSFWWLVDYGWFIWQHACIHVTAIL